MFIIHSLILLMNCVQSISQSLEYVYAYSWTPGFCYQHQYQYPGCITTEPYWTTNFTIHGLWSQYNTTGYPSFCTDEAFNTSIPELVGTSNMIQYWPNVQYDLSSPDYTSFWEHEWSKHGTCSGLSQYDYFNNAIQLTFRIPTPDILYYSIGNNMSANDLRNSFGGNDYVSLQCYNQYLTGIYTCWNQTNGIPISQIKCTDTVINEDTCKKCDTIMINKLD